MKQVFTAVSVPRSPDLVIFVTMRDRQTEPIALPLAYPGNKWDFTHQSASKLCISIQGVWKSAKETRSNHNHVT